MKRHAALDGAHERLVALWRRLSDRHGRYAPYNARRVDHQNTVRRTLDGLDTRLLDAADAAVSLHATADGIGSASYFELGFDYASRLKDPVDVYWFMQRNSPTMFLFHTSQALERLAVVVVELNEEHDRILGLMDMGSDGIDS